MSYVFRTTKQTKAAQVPIVAMFDLFWSWHENTQIMPITFHCLLSDLVSFCSILTIVDEFMKYQSHFLRSSLREAEGMCQHAAIKV